MVLLKLQKLNTEINEAKQARAAKTWLRRDRSVIVQAPSLVIGNPTLMIQNYISPASVR